MDHDGPRDEVRIVAALCGVSAIGDGSQKIYGGWAVAKSDKPPILRMVETQRKLVYKPH
jgi:hypothetical protein